MKEKGFLYKKMTIFLLTILYVVGIEMATRYIIDLNLFVKYFAIELGGIIIFASPILMFKSTKKTNTYSIFVVFIFTLLFFLNGQMMFGNSDIFYLRATMQVGELGKLNVLDFVSIPYLIVSILFLSVYIFTLLKINKFFGKYVYHKYFKIGMTTAVLSILLGSLLIGLSTSTIYKHNKELLAENNVTSGTDVINFKTKYSKMDSMKNYGQIFFYASEVDIMYFDGGDFLIKSVASSTVDDPDSTRFLDTDYTGLLEGKNVITIMLETGMYGVINEELTPNMWALKNGGIDFSRNYSKNKTGVSEHIAMMGSYPSTSLTYSKSNTQVHLDTTDLSLPNKFRDLGYETNYFHNGFGMYSRWQTMPQMGFTNYYNQAKINPYLPTWHFDGSYILDSITANNIKDKLNTTDAPFYDFWTTLSEHGPYKADKYIEVEKRTEYFNGNYDDYFEYLYPNCSEGKGLNSEELTAFNNLGLSKSDIAKDNIDYISEFDEAYKDGLFSYFGELDTDTYNELRYLQCAFMDLDKGIKTLVDSLKAAGKFDDTLFVFYGDHDPYYDQLSNRLNHIDTKVTAYPELYHTELFMYNKDLTDKYKELNDLGVDDKGIEYKYFSSPYIIVPTVLDLFGMDYDRNNYYMCGAFSDTSDLNNMFYSSEKQTFFTDKVYSIGMDADSVVYNKSEYDSYLLAQTLMEKQQKMIYMDELYGMNGNSDGIYYLTEDN